MSQTLEELQQTIKEAEDKIHELEASQRIEALELELAQQEDERLEAEAQEIYELTDEQERQHQEDNAEVAREETAERGQYTGERIAKDVQEMVKDLDTGEFTLKLRDNRVLFNVMTQIRKLVDEATFEVSSEGVVFRGMDPSHVALIDVSLPNSIFEEYEVSGEVKFGLRVDEFLLLFKKFDKVDRDITLTMGADKMLGIKSGKFNAKVRLIESSASSTPLPRLNFNAKLIIDVPTVRQISSFIDGLDYLAIESTSSRLNLNSKGDTGEFETSFDRDTNYDMVFEVKEDSKAVYSIDYLKPFITTFLRDFKAVQTDNLTVEYSSKMPLRISYRVLDSGRIHYYLAPRVQD